MFMRKYFKHLLVVFCIFFKKGKCFYLNYLNKRARPKWGLIGIAYGSFLEFHFPSFDMNSQCIYYIHNGMN